MQFQTEEGPRREISFSVMPTFRTTWRQPREAGPTREGEAHCREGNQRAARKCVFFNREAKTHPLCLPSRNFWDTVAEYIGYSLICR